MPNHRYPFPGYACRVNQGLAILILATLSTLPAGAQVLYGSLTGNVSDASRAAVPNAHVEVFNQGTGTTRQTATDDRGGYLMTNLQPGVYKVTVSAPALSTVAQSGVRVDENSVRRVDVELAVAQVNQTISVDASNEVALQTDRADVSAQLSEAQISNLPTSTARNFQNLFVLIPGYTSPVPSHSVSANPTGALATNVNGVSYSTGSFDLRCGCRSNRRESLCIEKEKVP